MALFCAVVWAAGFWASLGSVAITGSDTSARLGTLPPAWLLLVLVSFGAALVRALRLRGADAAPLVLAAAAWLPWIPGHIPGAFLLFDGPLGVTVALGVALVVIWRALRPSLRIALPVRTQTWLAGAMAMTLSLAAAWRMAPVIPGGDEPHYLIIAQSLIEDGDLQIENNHRQGDFRAYADGDLRPDYLKRGVNGQIYSIHAPGLAALVLPALALGGYPGVVLFLALVSAAVGVLAWRAAYRLTGSTQAAWIGWSGVALSVPFFFQSFTVYPDGPAALLVLIVMAALVRDGAPGPWTAVVFGAAIAALPWLHTRYALLAASLSMVVAGRAFWPVASDGHVPFGKRVRGVLVIAVLPLVSVCLWLWLFHAIYGRFDPRAPYGAATDEHLGRIPIGLTGLLLDQQFGLLPNAPIYVFALAGLATLWKQRPRLVAELAILAVPYVLAVAGFYMWWAGHSSPARFLVPVLLPLALPLAAWWQRHDSPVPRMFTGLALGASLALAIAMAWVSRGALVYNTRDGYALWLDVAAPSVNLGRALPSLFQAGVKEAWIRTGIWTVAFGSAWAALRIRERQVPAGGPWAAVAGGAVLVALIVGSSLAWAVSAEAYLEPGASLLRYTSALCSRDTPIAVAIPDGSRRDAPLDRIVWAGRNLAPGRYQVALKGGLNTSGHVMLAVGKPDAVAADCLLADAPPGPASCALALPAGARSLWVLADPQARRSLTGVDLLFQSDRDTSACDLRAERVISGAGQLLFVVSGTVYAEGAGGWIAGRAAGEFAAADGARVRVRIRNGETRNHVVITSGDWRDEWDAAPGETREVELPRPRRGLQRFSVTSADGFRPGDLHRDSRDWRLLGAWIEPM